MELFRLLRCHHGGGERMLDEIGQLVGIELHQLALLDADHPIAVGQHVRIMAHQQPGRSRLEGEPLLQHLGRDDGIQRREGVVQQQDIGLGIEGAGQGDPLLLATGETGTQLAYQRLIAMAEQGEVGAEGAGPQHPAIAFAVPGLAEQDVVADGVVHQPGLVAQVGDPTVTVDLPLETVVKAGDEVQQAALAGPCGARDPHQFPRLYDEVCSLQYRLLLVQGGDGLDLQAADGQAGIGEVPVLLRAVEELA